MFGISVCILKVITIFYYVETFINRISKETLTFELLCATNPKVKLILVVLRYPGCPFVNTN